MPSLARLGDSGSHGGAITTGSQDVFSNGKPVARVGDTYACPVHGSNSIVKGSSSVFANGLAVARLGDGTSCGAVITGGSSDVFSGDI